MGTYNLTDNQKDLVRWFVKQVRDGKMPEEFGVSWTFSGPIIGHFESDINSSLTQGALDALDVEGFLICREAKAARRCTLTGKAYDAVDNDFEAATSGDTRKKITEERLKSLFRQLKTYNGNLDKLLERAAKYGGIEYSSLDLQNQIEDIKNKISKIEKQIEGNSKKYLSLKMWYISHPPQERARIFKSRRT